MYEITIEKTFTASHALRLADGSLEQVHTHDWPVSVTVAAEVLDVIETVMDFHELERIVDGVIAPLSGVHINDVPPFDKAVNASAERIAEYIANQTAAALPGHVRLISVALGEAPGCTAVYRP
jgi:6-pyruvoyltetrahydropterin/6-carboxytetrahydropterin synthase